MTPRILTDALGVPHARATIYAGPLTRAMKRYGIDTPLRQAAFLGQITHESAMLTRVTENLNYSVEGLLSEFGRHRISEADARKFGRTSNRPADKEAIANLLYGGRWGAENLGNGNPGDGAKYIGRGLKQLTGKANFLAYMLHSGVDALVRPELLSEPEHAADSAGWFWMSKGLSKHADKRDWVTLTRVINGGTKGLKERIFLTEKALKALTPSS